MSEKNNKNVNRPDDDFSIEKELADMKKSLLVDEEDEKDVIDGLEPNNSSDSKPEEAPASETLPVEEVKEEPKEEIKEEPKPKPSPKKPSSKKTSTKKPASKKAPAKKATPKKAAPKKTTTKKDEVKPVDSEVSPKVEPAKKQASKKATPKKKPLTEAQKAAKKEKAKLAKQKEAQKRKEAIKKAKEKERVKMAAKQAKEKEKARLEALIKREKEKSVARAAARKAAEEKLASIENAQKNENNNDLEEIKMNKVTSPSGLEKIGPKRSEVKKAEDRPKDENVSESLQRLREQIAAKKDLERRIMDGHAQKEPKANGDVIKDNLKELEAKNKDLKEKLAKAQAEVSEESIPHEDNELARLRAEIASLEAKVAELEAKEAKALEDNANLKDQLGNLENDLNNKYSEALKVKEEEKALLQERLDNEVDLHKKEVEALNKASSEEKAKFENSLNKEFNAKVKALQKENNKELANKQKEVDAANRELTNAKIQLTKANNSLIATQNELEKTKDDYDQKLILANDEIGLLKRDLEDAKKRNVQDADILSEVEIERNKLVEQNRELEKEKKELELQNNYLNLYKQEINASAASQVKEANNELEKYKKENYVQEDLIRAEERVKYQELSDEFEEAKKVNVDLKEANDALEIKVTDLEKQLALKDTDNSRLKEDNDYLNNELANIKNQLSSFDNQELLEGIKEENVALKDELSKKELELIGLKSDYELVKTNLADEKASYAKQSEAIKAQLDELLKGVEENETSIANTALVIENYRAALESEKNAHFDAEEQLYEALKAKDEQIKKLEDSIKQVKFDNQIDQLTNMVQDLSRRDMYGPRPPFGKDYYRDPYEARISSDQDHEITKRDEIIAAIQKERKQEVDAFNAKIEALEAQVRDLNEALSKKQEGSSINVNYNDLEEYIGKIKGILVTNDLSSFNDLASLLDAYQNAKKEKNLIYTNECEKLDIANKYLEDGASKQTIKAKKEFLNDYYATILKELDANLEKASNDIKKGERVASPVVLDSDAEPVIVEIDNSVGEDAIKEVGGEPDGTLVNEEAPIYDTYEERAQALEELEPLAINETPLIEPASDDNQVIITFDSEYLNKLNNIRRTRKSLEERKVVETANHKIELSNNENLQKEYVRKIEELKNRIEEMTADYQNGEDHSEEALQKFEVEKQKVFFELTSRQSQLNKLSEDDVRKINLRYHNIIKGIEDQLIRLEEEEKELRETYLLKQAKEESKASREAALNKQFEEANVKPAIEEPRVLESQDEIRERKFRSRYEGLISSQPRKLIEDKDVTNIVVDDKGDVVSGVDNKVTSKEEPKEETNNSLFDEFEEKPVIKAKEEFDDEEKVDVKESKISSKEVELRKKYESFCEAERTYSNDIASVREYKRLKEQYLAIEKAIYDNNETISGLTDTLKASSDKNEIANLKAKINELKAKGESLKDNRDYVKKQCNDASKDKHVRDYNRLIQKIEDAADILKKYQAKRDKKAR